MEIFLVVLLFMAGFAAGIWRDELWRLLLRWLEFAGETWRELLTLARNK